MGRVTANQNRDRLRHAIELMMSRLQYNSMLPSAQPAHGFQNLAKTIGNAAGNANDNNNENTSASVRMLCKHGQLKEALQILHYMDYPLDSFTYDSLLHGCLKNTKCSLPEAKAVHAHMIQTQFESQDISLWNKLLTMYSKHGTLAETCRVFDQIPERDVISWTLMISAYSRYDEHAREAINLFNKMDVQPNRFTFVKALSACARLKSPEQGRDIHEQIIGCGVQSDPHVGNALVDMYSKCRCIEDAHQVFDKMPQWNLVSWNTMIAGYVQNGFADKARELFQKMPERDVVSWTAMIAGFAQNGQCGEALNCYRQMKVSGVKPNLKTFASVLPACANLEALEQGMEIHEEIIKCGFQSDVFVGSALVDMYAKCGRIENAREVFDKLSQQNVVSWTAMIAGYAQVGQVDEALELFQKMPKPNVVSWTAMIAGYAQNRQGEKALKLFRQMQVAGSKPNSNTFASILSACADLAAFEQGKEIHEEIIRSGFQSHVFAGNALVDMYAKCGSVEDALSVFENMPQRDVVTWSVMISGYAIHGSGKEALKLFEQMQHSGMKPDRVTFIGVLSACSHAGLVDEGQQYFDWMSERYHIKPSMEHYGCMADLLGRAGRLNEAHDFINKMPIKADASVWGCLLAACRIHHNIELGERIAAHLFEMDSKNASPYVLLSNIYAAAGWHDGIERVRKMMKDNVVKKKAGYSWIEVNKQVSIFVVGDRSHPQTEKIYAELEKLSRQMKIAGYTPDTTCVLNDAEE